MKVRFGEIRFGRFVWGDPFGEIRLGRPVLRDPFREIRLVRSVWEYSFEEIRSGIHKCKPALLAKIEFLQL